ncbi:DUF3080 domain-containing protein [Vibrio makurazakiensis]|uniref:DUF3080 domain-containing protein n=1 Tax=Vibrio makurazakiensis TaxID=2910250 RepID=UPI003D11DF15
MLFIHKVTRLSLLTLSSFSLLGCGADTPADQLIEYHKRISRVQDAPQIDYQFQSAPLPRKRELYLTIPSMSIGLLDSYQLRQCGLFNLIAEKNSVLGKVADEFRNYDYQVALLEGLARCLASNQLEPEIYQQLLDIEYNKKQQLSLHKWNLIYASDAMQAQLRGSGWLREDIDQQVLKVSHALNHIQQTIGEPRSALKSVDAQETLEKQRVLGDLNYSLSNSAAYLDATTKQLLKYDKNIICGKQRDTTTFRHLNNVFEQQYIGKIQPYMAQLDGYYQQLTPQLTMFDAQPELHNYYFPIVDAHQAFRSSTRRHVDYWQKLFKRCGRKVGR